MGKEGDKKNAFCFYPDAIEGGKREEEKRTGL